MLHLPDNIKVHWAGAEVMNQYIATKALGVNYYLYTAFPFVERMVFGKGKAPIMPLRWQKANPAHDIPRYIIDNNINTIQDSGLFTLLFGSRKGTKDEAILNRWYDALVQFTLENAAGAICVEMDCQDLIGTEKAWQFRERMKHDLPNNRIINVWHPIDGQKGLDRMIEFSDYISFSSLAFPLKVRREKTRQMAYYIKTKKPEIDIHILGCTVLDILGDMRFCTSCDSTTWTGVKRFGYIEGHHQKKLRTDKVRELFGDTIYNQVLEYNNETNTNGLLTNIERLKRQYEMIAGNQNYTPYENN